MYLLILLNISNQYVMSCRKLSYFLSSVNNAAVFHCVVDKQPIFSCSGLISCQADKERDFDETLRWYVYF